MYLLIDRDNIELSIYMHMRARFLLRVHIKYILIIKTSLKLNLHKECINIFLHLSFCCSGDTSPHYSSDANGQPNGFINSRSPHQTTDQPIDFSGSHRPLGFGMMGPNLAPAYSRESTPDSGGSHYMDSYRDPSGMYYIFIHSVVLCLQICNRIEKGKKI